MFLLLTILSTIKADIKALAARAHGFVGADLKAVCQEASMLAITRQVTQRSAALTTLPVVSVSDMWEAMKEVGEKWIR